MADEPHEVDPTTLSKRELVAEVYRLRQQIVDDQDHYRKCRDMMAEKLNSYNEKFNLQEEAIRYLDQQLKEAQSLNPDKGKLNNREVARVPEFPKQPPPILPAFVGF